MPSLPTPVLYRGVELLVIPPNRTDTSPRDESDAADTEGAAGASDALVPSVPDTALSQDRTLTWTVARRADLAALEAFLSRRRGRLAPFWCPTWRQDGTALSFVTGGTVMLVSGYATAFARLAAERGGRDHWITLHRNGTMTPYAVTAVTNNGDGTMTLNPEMGSTTTAGGTRFCRLEMVRLTDDEIQTTYLTGSVATIAVGITTVPRQSV